MSATDDFAGLSKSLLESPYTDGAAVTPSDSVDLGHVTRALYVGVTGDLEVTLSGRDGSLGGTVILKACPVGLMRVRATRVRAGSTTATNIVALW